MQKECFPFKTLPSVNRKKIQYFGQVLAAVLRRGDTVALHGELGTGKSTLCRAIIHSAMGKQVHVPSPTFTLVQIYDTICGEIWHMDWYRIQKPTHVLELGVEEAFYTGICLVEWASMAPEFLPHNALHIHIENTKEADDIRQLCLSGHLWEDRLQHIKDF